MKLKILTNVNYIISVKLIDKTFMKSVVRNGLMRNIAINIFKANRKTTEL